MREGYGVLEWIDGSKYAGEFVDDEMQGHVSFSLLKISRAFLTGLAEEPMLELGVWVRWTAWAL